jgi:hypothetical protein
MPQEARPSVASLRSILGAEESTTRWIELLVHKRMLKAP